MSRAHPNVLYRRAKGVKDSREGRHLGASWSRVEKHDASLGTT